MSPHEKGISYHVTNLAAPLSHLGRPGDASSPPVRQRAKDAVEILYRATVGRLIRPGRQVGASKDGRRIPLSIQHKKPLVDTRRGHAYISNDVRTSRYTVWDFIPKQLLFQFSRIGNFYFLCVGIPQTVCAMDLVPLRETH